MGDILEILNPPTIIQGGGILIAIVLAIIVWKIVVGCSRNMKDLMVSSTKTMGEAIEKNTLAYTDMKVAFEKQTIVMETLIRVFERQT